MPVTMTLTDNVLTNETAILTNIQNIQAIETQLLADLESGINAGTLTPDKQQALINKISELSAIRQNLYKSVSNSNILYTSAANSTSNTVAQQLEAIQSTNNILDIAQAKISQNQNSDYANARLTKINNYYSLQYEEYSYLFKIIFFVIFSILILIILGRKEIVPSYLIIFLYLVVGGVGFYFAWITIVSIMTRDNMNYQEYDWYFDKSKAPSISATSGKSGKSGVSGRVEINPWAAPCIGAACCSSTEHFDSALNVCLPTQK